MGTVSIFVNVDFHTSRLILKLGIMVEQGFMLKQKPKMEEAV